MNIPALVLVTGYKLAGKDTFCDALVQHHGYTKLHIAEPWLRNWCAAHDLNPDEWEAHKHAHRAAIQRDAQAARDANPRVLIDPLEAVLHTMAGPLVVSGVRFLNEVTWARSIGGFIVRVEVPDAVRRARFVAAGESLDTFHDPFEREIAQIESDCCVGGASTDNELVAIASDVDTRARATMQEFGAMTCYLFAGGRYCADCAPREPSAMWKPYTPEPQHACCSCANNLTTGTREIWNTYELMRTYRKRGE